MAKEGYGGGYSNHHASNDAAQASGNRPKGDGDWYENKYHQRFTEGLLTEQATTAYDKEQKLTEYRNDDDRRDILAEYVESFNNQKYDSDRERLKYAEQIAHNTFSPLYKEIDAVEHTNETLFDPRIIRALEHHNVDYDIVKRADGTSELRFDVKDASQHRMLEAATGTKIALHDSKKLKARDKAEAKAMGWDDPDDKADEAAEDEEEEHDVGTIGSGQLEDRFWTEAETRKMLDFHRAQFAAALHGSNENAGLAVEFMHQSLTDADNAQNHYTEKTLEFDKVRDKTAAEAASATEAMQDAHWKLAWDGLKEVTKHDEDRDEELEYFLSRVRHIYQKGASVALRGGNGGHYNLASPTAGKPPNGRPTPSRPAPAWCGRTATTGTDPTRGTNSRRPPQRRPSWTTRRKSSVACRSATCTTTCSPRWSTCSPTWRTRPRSTRSWRGRWCRERRRTATGKTWRTDCGR